MRKQTAPERYENGRRQPYKEHNQADCEAHQPGNGSILPHQMDEVSPGVTTAIFGQTLSAP
jgi:hypothetical protein